MIIDFCKVCLSFLACLGAGWVKIRKEQRRKASVQALNDSLLLVTLGQIGLKVRPTCDPTGYLITR